MDKLNPRDYQKQEKQFMCFGSLCNSLQNTINEKNKEEVAEWAWGFCREKVGEFMDELYKESNGESPF